MSPLSQHWEKLPNPGSVGGNEAHLHDPAKIFWLLLGLKQRLEDVQSVLSEGEKPPLPSLPCLLWEVRDGRERVQRDKHILSHSPLNLPCLCRAIKWSDALISKLQARET